MASLPALQIAPERALLREGGISLYLDCALCTDVGKQEVVSSLPVIRHLNKRLNDRDVTALSEYKRKCRLPVLGCVEADEDYGRNNAIDSVEMD